jgi:hypothetical protein
MKIIAFLVIALLQRGRPHEAQIPVDPSIETVWRSLASSLKPQLALGCFTQFNSGGVLAGSSPPRAAAEMIVPAGICRSVPAIARCLSA